MLGTCAVLAPAKPAHAYNTEIDASAAAQYYTLSSPYGDQPELRRRRYTTTLGMSLYDLTDDPRLNHRIAVVSGIEEARCRELLQRFFAARR